jgi:hypothetical protein
MLETPRVQILVASYSIDFPGKPSSHRLRGWAGCRKDCEFRRDPFFSYQASASRCRPFSSTCHTVPFITSSAVSADRGTDSAADYASRALDQVDPA